MDAVIIALILVLVVAACAFVWWRSRKHPQPRTEPPAVPRVLDLSRVQLAYRPQLQRIIENGNAATRGLPHTAQLEVNACLELCVRLAAEASALEANLPRKGTMLPATVLSPLEEIHGQMRTRQEEIQGALDRAESAFARPIEPWQVELLRRELERSAQPN
ncbi:hypothetical protein HNR42_001376 [Deinobacterium chartae]|uniref:Uncharacterized protein n=1 Tax=Deinobacterium chartae TaxID=521158 RepID=A0A841HYJ0_9DEIO|nr:hypothetical protein [Deinobacterium chartae]MBB6097953.1 hypothetical protein [Deinobacterium chartae]